ncbi:MAG: hypothetical protein U9N77_01670 [Thermodesulfobacteriota bacterium]|nr:hypothetical protein [Thermodesulfobacteriota bacterium]
MKSIEAEIVKDSTTIKIKKDAKEEDWIAVCTKFNNDVERVRDVKDQKDFTALYECFDDDNKNFFYLVKEDKKLYSLRRKHFLNNIGTKFDKDN